MKKVLLLGDSIRMGYDEFVKEELAGEFEVYYDELDNGRFAAYTLWQANQFFKKCGKFDVVHWNNGYWDMNIEAPMTEPLHPIGDYVTMLGRILAEIRKNGAVPVFATSVPILPKDIAEEIRGEGMKPCNYDNAWVIKYNDVAVSLMKNEGVMVNDLYSLCLKDKYFYKCPDLLHLTEEGYRQCAAQAAAAIRKAAGITVKLSEIFADRPETWGYRGDPYFWDYLEKAADTADVKSGEDLEAWIKSEFKKLTAKDLTADTTGHVKEFEHGGMSSGGIDGNWWIEEGIPLLRDRLK